MPSSVSLFIMQRQSSVSVARNAPEPPGHPSRLRTGRSASTVGYESDRTEQITNVSPAAIEARPRRSPKRGENKYRGERPPLKKRAVRVTKKIPSLPAIPEHVTHGDNDNNGNSKGGKHIDACETTCEEADKGEEITSDHNAGSDLDDGNSLVHDTCTLFFAMSRFQLKMCVHVLFIPTLFDVSRPRIRRSTR